MLPNVDINVEIMIKNPTLLYIVLTAQSQSTDTNYIIAQLVIVFFKILKIAKENTVQLEPITPIPSLSKKKKNMLIALFKFESNNDVTRFFISLKNREGSL